MEVYSGCKSVLSNSELIVNKRILLRCGYYMPIFGLGTYKLFGDDNIYNTIDWSLSCGYRLIDTASVYGNEVSIGNALKALLPKYNLKREDIFITTKLAPSDHADRAENAIKTSLEKLNVDYIDLYLIHWPGVRKTDVANSKNAELRKKSWKVLEKYHNHGKGVLKSIGVSNYTSKHLKEVMEDCQIVPSVNQVEFHPYYQLETDEDFYEICAKNNILLQAYYSLGGSNNVDLHEDPVIASVAEKYSKSRPQILLRWALQAGYCVIPKSQTKERIIENSKLDFNLSDHDFFKIKSIQNNKKYAWDPQSVL